MYPEKVNSMLKKFATNKAISEFDAAFLRYMQTRNMEPQQYADELVAKS